MMYKVTFINTVNMCVLTETSKIRNIILWVNNVNPVFFILTMEGSLVNKTDLQALYLSGTYCHKTGTRPPSCKHVDNRLYIYTLQI